jgi:type II secretory ATPase GspE/PulE/Tfp pilus assembly ATPase PilB-like protein
VATAGAIEVVLRKGDATQRVLQEAASGFRISLVKETEQGEEVLDLDRLATDSEMSPIIKLVDTIIYNAMESRASDIHIETRDTEVQVKYRIDGALYEKVDPIDLAYHQTLISRIKVMSELDIAERRVPQDGRFRVRYKGRNVDFRVSIMPTDSRRRRGHSYSRQGADQRRVSNLNLTWSVSIRRRPAQVSPLHRRAVRHGAGDGADRFG